jgi:hypothetical protein
MPSGHQICVIRSGVNDDARTHEKAENAGAAGKVWRGLTRGWTALLGEKKGKFRQDRRREPPVCERTPLGETATRTRPLGYGLSN